MIRYKITQARDNLVNKGAISYYPVTVANQALTLRQIADRIEKRSTASSADVKAVLDALQYEVIEALRDGNTVRLGDLGSFRLTLVTDKAETLEEATKAGANLIKGVKVQFTKSTAMRDRLTRQSLSFERTSPDDTGLTLPEEEEGTNEAQTASGPQQDEA